MKTDVLLKALCLCLVVAVVPGCTPSAKKEQLIIFHAGSLTEPLAHIAEAFQKKNQGVEMLRESSGSVQAARKITDLEKPADVMASADYAIIPEMLIPKHADFYVKFATNEMVIMYRPDSRFADEITARNWPEILLRSTVEYGHSDPNADPCGYRSQLVWQLAEKYYGESGLYEALRKKVSPKNIRPKETDLLALLDAGELDYIFIYRSVAEQHKSKYIVLPDEVNLKSPALAKYYGQAQLEVAGKSPDEKMIRRGEPMIYGVTVLRNAPHYKLALEFARFLLGAEGQAIMIKDLHPIVPPQGEGIIPPELKTVVVSGIK